MSSLSMQSLASRLRLASVVLSITMAMSAVMARMHQASVRHAYCAEHGVVEDRPAAAAETGLPPAPGDLPTIDAAVPQRHAGVDHDGCVFALVLQPVRPADAPTLAQQPNERTAPVALAAGANDVRTSVLASAPKTSPPLALVS